MIPDVEAVSIIIQVLDSFELNYTIKFNHKALLYLMLGLCKVLVDKIIIIYNSIHKLHKIPQLYIGTELLSKA